MVLLTLPAGAAAAVSDVYGCLGDSRNTACRALASLREPAAATSGAVSAAAGGPAAGGRELLSGAHSVVAFTLYAPSAGAVPALLYSLASLCSTTLGAAMATAVSAPAGFTAAVGPYAASLPGCGDGVRGASEAYDDGYFAGGDGCSAVCSVEPGASCVAAADGADRCTPASPLAQAAAAVAARVRAPEHLFRSFSCNRVLKCT